MNWIQKYKAVIDMNKKWITFQIDVRKFTTKLVSNIKPQNKIHYYMINKSENIIDLTLREDNIIKAIEGDDKRYSIMIDLKEDNIFLENDSKIKQISDNLKDKFLDEAITSYKNKY